MLVLVVVLNMAARERFGALIIVFNVIGAQTLLAIADVHVVVGDKQISFPALRARGREFGDTALDPGRTNLLCGRKASSYGRKRDRKRQ